jgi:hypothetical protein
MRKVAIVAGAALLCLITSCSSAAKRTGPAASPTPARIAQLTPDQAMRTLRGFLPRLARARSNYSTGQITRLATGAQARILAFQSRIFGFYSSLVTPALGTLTGLKVYVPRLADYPRWFVASGTGTAAAHPVLLVLTQAGASAPWQLAIEMPYYLGTNLAGVLQSIRLDSAGYADAVPVDDAALRVSPVGLSAGLAAQQDSPHGPALFAPGPSTTGLLSQDRAAAATAARLRWRITDVWRASNLPVYALGSKNGGAVAIFVTNEQYSWTALSAATRLADGETKAVNQLAVPAPAYASVAGSPSPRASLCA